MYFDDLLVGPTQCLARCSHNTDCECISFHHFSSEFCSSSRYWNALEMRAQNAPARPRSIETRSKCAFRYWRALKMRARVLAVLERAQNAHSSSRYWNALEMRVHVICTRSNCARALYARARYMRACLIRSNTTEFTTDLMPMSCLSVTCSTSLT